ncbi:DUF6520 family protein [Salegentibacter sp. JZCK2]|uniref:DUF6520 family protein n=1 Tax=Salegentibacter tibetensis TaxID=2873600 RepID=UPI001CCB931F|nr:DUF6520 family protein [Salegentibacter tibetensis]MBZ9730766.1 DUF6520 family protein [Salegentibacter tibetensis]
MKNFKFLMPMLAFVMAVGMAFANKANVQSPGWVERDGMPYQLENETCTAPSERTCEVIFTDDPNTVHQVYTDSDLLVPKDGGSEIPYILNE